MGQYYRIVNLDKRETLDPFKFGNGMKLIESCYVGNAYVDAITYLMTNDWHGDTVLFCGDYAWDSRGSADKTLRELAEEDPYQAAGAFADRSGDFASTRGNKVLRELAPGRWGEVPVEGTFRIDAGHYRYVVDETLGVYYDREKAPVAWVGWWKGEPVITRTDPLTIFMAVGNGLGCGDYGDDRPNALQAGSWAGHVVSGANEPPAGLAEIECPFDASGMFVTKPDVVIREAMADARLDWARTSIAELAEAVADLSEKRRAIEGTIVLSECIIEWKDEPGIPEQVLIAESDTQGYAVDGCVFFCGMSADEAFDAVGKDIGEDFVIKEFLGTTRLPLGEKEAAADEGTVFAPGR